MWAGVWTEDGCHGLTQLLVGHPFHLVWLEPQSFSSQTAAGRLPSLQGSPQMRLHAYLCQLIHLSAVWTGANGTVHARPLRDVYGLSIM